MNRLAFALALALAACSGSAKKEDTTTTTGSGGGGGTIVAKRVSLSWGVTQQGEMSDLFLQTTDETGHQVSHDLGRWKGVCQKVEPDPAMNALIALDCRTGGTGTQLQALLHGGDEIVVMKLGIDEGVTADPMAREEVKRIKIPLGAKVEAGT